MRLNLMTKMFIAGVLALVVGPLCVSVQALTIEITEGQETGMPIAVVPFQFQGQQRPSEDIRQIVSANLYRSGRFLSLAPDNFLRHPTSHDQVRFRDWRLIKAEALVIGRVKQVNDGYEVSFRLYDVYKQKQLAGYIFTVGSGSREIRQIAHRISDYIYEALTGVPGVFDTQIAYVTTEGSGNNKLYQLKVAQSDGHHDQTVLETSYPVLSPAWAPDAKHLAYVSFGDDKRGATIWLQNLYCQNCKREKLLEERVSSPAWSPDGRRLAVTLYRNGNSDIYIIEISTRRLRRLTKHPGIDTEASWSPNGRHLVFTSNRSGRPQIYRISAAGGRAERLTKVGRENLNASYSPDGKQLVMVTKQGNKYQIGVFYVDSRELEILTDPSAVESPTFSPNGAMIMFATQKGGKGVLVAVSADGERQNILRVHQGEVREPAWSSRKQ